MSQEKPPMLFSFHKAHKTNEPEDNNLAKNGFHSKSLTSIGFKVDNTHHINQDNQADFYFQRAVSVTLATISRLNSNSIEWMAKIEQIAKLDQECLQALQKHLNSPSPSFSDPNPKPNPGSNSDPNTDSNSAQMEAWLKRAQKSNTLKPEALAKWDLHCLEIFKNIFAGVETAGAPKPQFKAKKR